MSYASVTSHASGVTTRSRARAAAAGSSTLAAPASSPTASDPSLEPQSNEIWYLAYGSNMNSKVLEGRRKVKPLSSLPCTVSGYRLDFNYRALPYIEPGFATLNAHPEPLQALPLPGAAGDTTPAPEHRPASSANGTASTALAPAKAATQPAPVTAAEAYAELVAAGCHGVAHLITLEQWERVKATEGVSVKGLGYQVVTVKCDLYGGGWVMAATLSAAPAQLGAPGSTLPSKRYIGILQEGAREHGLDPAYCAALDRFPGYSPSPSMLTNGARFAVLGSSLGAMTLGLPMIFVITALDKVAGIAMLARHAAARAVNASAPPPPPPKKQQSTLEKADMAGANGGIGEKTLPPKMSIARRFFALRAQFSHPIMTYYIFFVTSGVWLLHDYVLAPLAGSGCNNMRKP